MDKLDLQNLSPEVLKYINALQKENADLKDKVHKQDIHISNLTEMLVNARKKIFGKSSEQTQYIDGSEQLSLFNEAEKESAAGAA
ncbi:MAG: transposase, partial [Ruminiclostridium sp.]|nr:transposase [Ruminiclostridium sp.]